MIWLIGELWGWMVASAALGALATAGLMLHRVPVERWVEIEVGAVEVAERPSVAELPDEDSVEERERLTGVDDLAGTEGWPFPSLPGGGRPWEAEELWSRPAVVAHQGVRRSGGDAWTEAASSWRTWADEVVTRPVEPSGVDDDGLFAADREAERLGLEVGVFPTSMNFLVAPERGDDRDEDDPFPYAAPVDAPGYDNVEPFPARERDDRRSA